MAITQLQGQDYGSTIGQGLGNVLSSSLQNMAHIKLQNLLQQQQQAKQQQQLLQQAQGIRSLNPNLSLQQALGLASNPEMSKQYFDQYGFGLSQPTGFMQNLQSSPSQPQPNPIYDQLMGLEGNDVLQKLSSLSEKGAPQNPLQALLSSPNFQQPQAAMAKSIQQQPQAQEIIKPNKNNESAYVLSTIKAPQGKRQEALVKRAQHEQDQLQKLYGEKIEKINEDAQYADTSDAFLQQQADLINTGKMPTPTFSALRKTVGHGAGGGVGAAVGSKFGPVGAAIGSLIPGIDLSSWEGTEGNMLEALNVQMYEAANKIFKRLTEKEFGKFELGLAKLTDTDEAKIKKLNIQKQKNDKSRVINKYLQDIINENDGYYTRNMIAKAEKLASPELHKIDQEYRQGKRGFKLQYQEPQAKTTNQVGNFGSSWNLIAK